MYVSAVMASLRKMAPSRTRNEKLEAQPMHSVETEIGHSGFGGRVVVSRAFS